MSYTVAKSQLKTALEAITWVNPASSAGTSMATKTAFKVVYGQQFAEDVPVTNFPFCRISLPDMNETRFTSGSDTASYKKQLVPAHLFMYNAEFGKDAIAAGEFFDNMVDSVMAAFRNNAAPQQGPVALTANDHIIAWGLHQRAKIEPPYRIDNALHYRGTIALDLLMVIV